MDPTLPARIQFAFTISFHYIYPPITIGLGLILVVLGVLHLRTGNPVWNQALRFWVRIYALNFAVGIATGWSRSSSSVPTGRATPASWATSSAARWPLRASSPSSWSPGSWA